MFYRKTMIYKLKKGVLKKRLKVQINLNKIEKKNL